jgi:hypothetical protein
MRLRPDRMGRGPSASIGRAIQAATTEAFSPARRIAG